MTAKETDYGITGLDHVDIVVKNLEKSRRFFTEQLKVDVVGEGPDHVFLLIGDQVLGLHAPNGTPSRTGGVDHIALRVDNWTGLRSRLRRARIEIVDEKERDDSRSLYLKGPDGLSLELVWRPDPHRHPATGPAAPG